MVAGSIARGVPALSRRAWAGTPRAMGHHPVHGLHVPRAEEWARRELGDAPPRGASGAALGDE
eukprot:10690165-Alexandrium_andersonii.AAC.1